MGHGGQRRGVPHPVYFAGWPHSATSTECGHRKKTDGERVTGAQTTSSGGSERFVLLPVSFPFGTSLRSMARRTLELSHAFPPTNCLPHQAHKHWNAHFMLTPHRSILTCIAYLLASAASSLRLGAALSSAPSAPLALRHCLGVHGNLSVGGCRGLRAYLRIASRGRSCASRPSRSCPHPSPPRRTARASQAAPDCGYASASHHQR